jgi:hypothetical protein
MSQPHDLRPDSNEPSPAGSKTGERATEVEFSQTPADEVRAAPHPAAPDPLSQPRRVGPRARSGWSPIVRWGGVAAAAFMITLLIVTWSALRATGREEAEPLIARALVSLTEIDALLDSGYADLLAEAARRPNELLTLPHYPLPVSLGAEEITALSRGEFRARLLRDSASLVHDDGIGAFRRESGRAAGGIFSARGVIRWSVGRLSADTHEILWLALAIVLMLAAPALIIVVAASAAPDRLRNMGIASLIGGLLMVIASLSTRFALRATANGAGDPFNEALLDIGADTLAIVLRNAVIVALLGLSLLGLGVAARALDAGMLRTTPSTPLRQRGIR